MERLHEALLEEIVCIGGNEGLDADAFWLAISDIYVKHFNIAVPQDMKDYLWDHYLATCPIYEFVLGTMY